MILRTDTEFKPLKEHQLHTLLTPKLVRIMSDIKKTACGDRYTNPDDKRIANLDQLARRFGLEFYLGSDESMSGCGGLCYLDYNEIWINENLSYEKTYQTLAHEIGHIIQYHVGSDEHLKTGLLSQEYKFEQQCDAIAQIICSSLFSYTYDIPYSDKLDDITWLGNYYEGWLDNDLIVGR
jgi:hypothetical protein